MRAPLRHLCRIREIHVVIAATIAMLIVALSPSFGQGLEDIVQRAALIAGPAARSKVVIAAVDERSIAELGAWPWSADKFAKILDQLHLMNAEFVLLDPQVAREMPPNLLRTFAQRGGRPWLITGYEFYPTLSDLPDGYELQGKGMELKLGKLALPASPRDDSTLPAMAGVDPATLKQSAEGTEVGFTNIFPDRDGVVRAQPLAVRLAHRAYPSVALGAAAKASGFTPLISEGPSGRPSGVSIGDETIATGEDAALAIDFAAFSGKGDAVSALELHGGTADAGAISGRIALFGVTEPDIAHMYPTPAGKRSAAEIIASELAQITSGSQFRSFAGQPWTSLAIILAALLYILLIRGRARGYRALWTAVAAAATFILGVALCSKAGTLIPAVHFALALALLIAASFVWRLLAVDLPSRTRLAPFRMRLAPHILRRAAEDPRAFDPDGRECDVAAYAVDIRGFGAISRSLGAEGTLSLLRGYRKLVAEPLLANGAFIDSWSADECRAAFGAIAPDENRANAACKSAIVTLHAVAAARERVTAKYGVEKLRLGIGIWLGRAHTGELGPAGAANFGVAGEAMEAAATLRALNRTYRTSVLVNDEVRLAAERSFRFRPLDPIAIQACARPIVIHELVGEIGVIMPQLPKYLAARSAYLKGDFDRAAHLFGEILVEHPHDGPSHLFLRRSKTLLESPPKAEWLGVWQGP